MRTSKIVFTAVVVAGLLISGCTKILPTSDGQKVRVLGPSEVLACRELGTVNISVTTTAFSLPRPAQTIAWELEAVARNSATDMKGDTIVPLTVIDDGHQTFVVYDCLDANG